MNKTEILQKCTVDGNIVRLPEGQLDRKLYQEVAKTLELIGGKWVGRKTMGFVFPNDPTELLEQIANGESRNLKKEFQFFATPKQLAKKLVELAELNDNDTILEPSAGQGAIISEINNVTNVIPDCYELMETNVLMLNKSGLNFNYVGSDFLKNNGKKYSKIIANPPFSKNQDIEHLMEMYNVLEDGGKLVCITSESWVHGTQSKHETFKQWLKSVNGEVTEIPSGTFNESGTMVGGRIIEITK